ncbi:glycoside hydrolase family 15 protein [Kribbella sp. NPDC049174]|uniref:glycoside hydrolase family 15 protein n=1 Tax=Kribbella sp. NPDC049174 TaxID=3364112 RepID=UPI003723B4CD
MTRQIQDYALIGDLRTAALVSKDGAIDWLSLPRFDSPAVCAALLGDAGHGQWTLAPFGRQRCSRRRYRTNTLVLETEWTTPDGMVRVTDLMVPGSPAPMVVRIVDGLVGTVAMRTRIAPRMGYGKNIPTLYSARGQLVAASGEDELWLESSVHLSPADGSWTGAFIVNAGERVSFTLTYAAVGEAREPAPSAGSALTMTTVFWTDWASRSTYSGPWDSEVMQSLIILKALTYAPTGSILAAATTSLPERIGGSRNWDYRYSWLRDATFTLQALLATGYLREAEEWRDWLLRTIIDSPSGLQIMYAVDGAGDLHEETLDWLPGHAGSTPVRVGNGAATQQQNDVWGEVLDILATARDAGVPDANDQEMLERILLDQIESHWQDPDHGLWEVRGPRRHFLHSKLLAWVGVDRTVRTLAQHSAQEPQQLGRLRALRRTIAREISDRGYHAAHPAFTQSYGSPRLDAAALLLPRYGLLQWTDPRMVATVEAIQRDLTDHGLVLRYAVSDDGHNVDGVPGSEGTFLAASFWLADALHGIGRGNEATELFERLLSLRNDVGLLSEEYDPRAGCHLGNTPQALSHAGLVTTAVTLTAASSSASSSPAAPELQSEPGRGMGSNVA